MSSINNIPEDPRENLNRLRSIFRYWKESKIKALNAKLNRAKERLEGINNNLALAKEAKETESPNYRQSLQIRERFQYDVDNYREAAKKLANQISWAENHQIPFLESVVKKLELEKEKEA